MIIVFHFISFWPVKIRLAPLSNFSLCINVFIKCPKVEINSFKSSSPSFSVCINTSVGDVRAAYFPFLVSKTRGNPQILFDTLSHIVSHLLSQVFQIKIVILRAHAVIFKSFLSVSLPKLIKLVDSINTSFFPLDVLFASLFKNVLGWRL